MDRKNGPLRALTGSTPLQPWVRLVSSISVPGITTSTLSKWKPERSYGVLKPACLIIASPAIATDGTIYFGSSDATFYALNADGSLKWEFFAPDELDSSPALAIDGTIYFGCYNGSLYALNPDGSQKWAFQTDTVADRDNRILLSPAIDAEGNIFFGSGNYFFYSVDANGNLRWKFETEGEVDSSPAIDVFGNLYFASRDGYFYALDTDGVETWSAAVGEIVYSSPAVDDEGNVYFASFAGDGASRLLTYTFDGQFRWQLTLPGIVDSSPTLSPNGTLYIGVYDGNLFAVETGLAPALETWPQFSHDREHTGRQLADKTLPPLWADVEFLFDDWVHSDWFGDFTVNMQIYPWIFHAEHGWIWNSGQSQSSIWFWDDKLGWFWTSQDGLYPFLYKAEGAAWLWYYVGTGSFENFRWFHDFSINEDVPYPAQRV